MGSIARMDAVLFFVHLRLTGAFAKFQTAPLHRRHTHQRLTNIYEKLEVISKSEAVAKALRDRIGA